MPLALTDLAIPCPAELLQDLPPDLVADLAREHKAFVRAKKVKTPERTVAGLVVALLWLWTSPYARWRGRLPRCMSRLRTNR